MILALCLAVVASADVKPFLSRNCVACHSGKTPAGNLALQPDLPLTERARWEHIARRIRSGEMPPQGSPRPAQAEAEDASRWIDSYYERLDRTQKPDPGRVTLRRLNRFEYGNSVRDLLGIDLKAGDDFPADPYGYGFDNIGDVLSLSPVLAEKYLKSAEKIARAAIPIDGETPRPTMERYLAERMGQDEQLHLTVDHVFPADGEYTLRTAWYQALRDGAKVRLRLSIDGREVGNGVLSFYYQIDRALEAPNIRVTAGRHRVEADIEVLPDPPYKGKPPYLEYLQVYGPMKVTPAAATSTYQRFFPCGHAPGRHESACARRTLAPLARRAWRRPVEARELDELLSLAAKQASFEQGMRVGLQAILVSPHFLFRTERAAHLLSSHELASRLSYFLWSSLPDEELSTLADQDRLRDSKVLRDQVTRMLRSPRSRALVESFAGQWLQTRNLAVLKPDRQKFPAYNAELRDAMRTETEMFFEAMLREDRGILDFLDARFTFLNEPLARHYGIEGVTGPRFRRVELDGRQRSGVLTHASVLTVSSYPTRTSPVIRGKWVLENILNSPPPPPPPNVPGLDEQAANTGSLRQQLEKHRTNSACAACHSRMDPLGFGLENYDAIGKWREEDASGVLPNGKSFTGPAELKAILKEDRDAFTSGLVEKMLTYALGRGTEMRDRAAIRQITARLRDNGYRFTELIHGVVESVPFRMRRPEGVTP